jgi:hypothetical protein
MRGDRIFTDRDDRPAVLRFAEGVAVAVLQPGGAWVRVGVADAAEARFGPLPPLPSPDSVPATARHSPVDAAS